MPSCWCGDERRPCLRELPCDTDEDELNVERGRE